MFSLCVCVCGISPLHLIFVSVFFGECSLRLDKKARISVKPVISNICWIYSIYYVSTFEKNVLVKYLFYLLYPYIGYAQNNNSNNNSNDNNNNNNNNNINSNTLNLDMPKIIIVIIIIVMIIIILIVANSNTLNLDMPCSSVTAQSLQLS